MFVGTLCPFQKMLSVFVGLLCGLLSMPRALLGTRREFVAHPHPQRGTSPVLTTPRGGKKSKPVL
jgi:hypothetical protein